MNLSMGTAFIEKLTGAKSGEVKKTIYCFLALFFLLISYYLVKPLRNSAFQSVFPPDYEQAVFLVSVFLSLGVTQVFNHFFDRIDMHRMLRYTYITVILFKIGFFILLSTGAWWPVILFYFFATVYFLLCIAVTWGSINFLFNPEQSKRCYGFIAAGTMLGSTAGTFVTTYVLSFNLRYELLLVSAVFLSLAMLFAHLSKQGLPEWIQPRVQKTTPQRGIRVVREIRELMSHKYVRCIGIMVFALAVSNTVTNFQVQKTRDISICRSTFLQIYSDWKPEKPELKEKAFDFIYGAKLSAREVSLEDAKSFLHEASASISAEKFMDLYGRYLRQLGVNYKAFWNNIFKWVSILGLSLLIFCSRFIFRFFGVRFSSLLLPCFFLGSMVFLMTNPDFLGIQMILILAGSLDYSLNNATKEVFYTPTSPEAKGKYKPIIEGPLMRMGDFTAAITSLGCLSLIPMALQNFTYIGFGIAVIMVWIGAVWYAGTVFQKKEEEQGPRFVIP